LRPSSQQAFPLYQADAYRELHPYDAEVDVKIAERVNDDEMKKQAIARLQRLEKALDLLNDELAVLKQ